MNINLFHKLIMYISIELTPKLIKKQLPKLSIKLTPKMNVYTFHNFVFILICLSSWPSI